MLAKNARHFCLLIMLILFFACSKKDTVDNSKHLINGTSYTTADTTYINVLTRLANKIVRTNPDSGSILLDTILCLSRSKNYMEGIGNGIYIKGFSFYYLNNYDSALYHFNKALEIFKETDNKRGMGDVLMGIGFTLNRKMENEKAMIAFEEAKVHFEQIENLNKVYDCLNYMVYLCKRQNKHKERTAYLEELIEVAQLSGNLSKLANSHIIKGNYYIDQNDINQAVDAYFEALKVAEKAKDSLQIAYALNSVGIAYYYLLDFNKSIDYYLKQEKVLLTLKNFDELVKTHRNLALAYNSLGENSTALEYQLKVYDYCNENNRKYELAKTASDIGHTYLLIDINSKEVPKYINEAIALNKEFNNETGLADNYYLLGKYYYYQSDYSIAEPLLLHGIQIAEKINYYNLLLMASEVINSLYLETKNFEKAYKYLTLSKEIGDSILNRKNLKKITQLEMQHDFDKEQNVAELKHLQEKIQIEAELKRNKLARNYSILVGILLIALGAYAYRSYLLSRKANKEKEALLKEIHHRVKNNLQVISSLLNLQSGKISDVATKAAVTESQSRVKSMALIHQLLYQSELFTSIDFSKYLEQLMASLQSSYNLPDENVKFKIESDPIKLDIDTAIPLGLIVNELATNAYKYAFKGKDDGLINISFTKTPDRKLLLTLADNGKGFPADFDIENSTSLGLKLVRLLTQQLKAKLEYEIRNGAVFKIYIPEAA